MTALYGPYTPEEITKLYSEIDTHRAKVVALERDFAEVVKKVITIGAERDADIERLKVEIVALEKLNVEFMRVIVIQADALIVAEKAGLAYVETN